MYYVINNLYRLIVSLEMETGSMPDRSNNISVSIGLQNMMDHYRTVQKAIRYNGTLEKHLFSGSFAESLGKTLENTC